MLTPRLYTIEGARRTLPLVRRIVGDVVRTAAEMQRLQSPGDDEILDTLQTKLRKYAAELDSLGVELKDPVTGLVDFYWKRGDETVYLCWKHGEEGIDHWHDLQSGFGGRQPLGAVDLSLDATPSE